MTGSASLYQRTEGDPQAFAAGYLAYLADVLARLDLSTVAQAFERLDHARRQGQTIFIIGNGGSAATASHMANDLLNMTYKVPGVVPAFRVMALTDNMAVFSAIANDDGYDQVFVRQLATLFRTGDVLVSISASGNSPNLVAAARWAQAHGGINVGLLGFDGGVLLPLCDTAVVVKTPPGDYGIVEDAHMIMDHVITGWFQQHLKASAEATDR